MNRRFGPEIPGRFILFILVTAAAVLLFVSYTTGFSGGIIRSIAETVFVPMERGISLVAGNIALSAEQAATMEGLREENDALKAEVKRLTSELSGVALRKNELEELRSLLALKDTYSNYETTGAYVIGSGTSNWFSTFIIDKGREDGIEVDMNVLADEGLVGIITSVGRNHATVRSIIDDSSNVSATASDSGENLIVKGSIQTMTESGVIELSGLNDPEGKVKPGDTIVTSRISDKYVPGLLIGYITALSEEANGLTKSGFLVPVVDFKHLNEVLVVRTMKQQTGEDSQ